MTGQTPARRDPQLIAAGQSFEPSPAVVRAAARLRAEVVAAADRPYRSRGYPW